MTGVAACRWMIALEASVIERRVVIDVRPRLLSDALVRALRGVDAAVVVGVEPTPGEVRLFDVAVVMDVLPDGFRADTVIQLPDNGGRGAASITTARGTESACVGDLVTLLETVDRYLRSA